MTHAMDYEPAKCSRESQSSAPPRHCSNIEYSSVLAPAWASVEWEEVEKKASPLGLIQFDLYLNCQ